MPSKTITIAPADGTWVVRAAGAVLAESSRALELHEDGYPPVIYFPREDIGMAFLDPSDTVTTSPGKGEARHFHFAARSGTIADAAWSYETPAPELAAIAGHIAFYRDKATTEQI